MRTALAWRRRPAAGPSGASPGRGSSRRAPATPANRPETRRRAAPIITTLTPNYVLLAAHILSMLGFSTYAALLPELRDLWRLSNSQAGLIGGMFFAGYVATVSFWTALTDRVDARKVYLAGGVLTAAGGAGFGLAADGLASAIAFQLLLGAGIAATYMPGL